MYIRKLSVSLQVKKASGARFMRQYYHICTEGLGNDLIFRTDKDYIRGMNAIGILAYRHGISILAFCLMDNHVHIVAAAANEANHTSIYWASCPV